MSRGAPPTALGLALAAGTLALGLGTFFLGLLIMRFGIGRAAGQGVRRALRRATGHPVLGLASGLVLSLVFQSTSIVAVVLMEFLDADLLTFEAATGVVLGSNIGAALTVQFLALRLYEWAVPLAAAGFLLQLLARPPRLRSAGTALLGFGLLYGGIYLVTLASVPLIGAPFLREGLLALSHSPVGAGLFGLTLTAVVQSNGIANGILLSLARQGLLPLSQAVAVITGANLGSGTLALLAAIPSGRRARRLAVANALVNVAGLIWVVPGFGLVLWALDQVSPNLPQALANAHILFNVLASLTVLPFVPAFARLCALLADHLFPPSREVETLSWSPGSPH